MAESPRLLEEALRSGIEIDRVFVSERVADAVLSKLSPHQQFSVHPVADRLFAEVSTTTHNQGVLALVRLPSWGAEDVLSGLALVMDGVQDPGNAGAIVRSAEAFGASGVVFLKGSAAPTNPKTLRAAAGSIFRIPFLAGVNVDQLLEFVASARIRLLAAESLGDTPLHELNLTEGAAIVVGSETHGITPKLLAAAETLSIPTQGVESLNVAAAATVVLYEWARQRLTA